MIMHAAGDVHKPSACLEPMVNSSKDFPEKQAAARFLSLDQARLAVPHTPCHRRERRGADEPAGRLRCRILMGRIELQIGGGCKRMIYKIASFYFGISLASSKVRCKFPFARINKRIHYVQNDEKLYKAGAVVAVAGMFSLPGHAATIQ